MSVDVTWTGDLEATGWSEQSLKLLDPGTLIRRRRWTRVLSEVKHHPPLADVGVIVVGHEPTKLDLAVARTLGTALLIQRHDVAASAFGPARRLVVIGPNGALSGVMRYVVDRIPKHLQWGLLTGMDDASIVFLAAKARAADRRPRHPRLLVADGTNAVDFDPCLLDESWDVAVIKGHGDGQHLNLGTVVLCGEARSTEQTLSGIEVDGCGTGRCRRGRTPRRPSRPIFDLVASHIVLLSCNSLDLVGVSYPTTNSLVTGAVDGWAASVAAISTSVTVTAGAWESIKEDSSVEGLSQRLGAPVHLVGVPRGGSTAVTPDALAGKRRVPGSKRPVDITRLSRAVSTLTGLDLAYRRRHPDPDTVRSTTALRLDVELAAQSGAHAVATELVNRAFILVDSSIEDYIAVTEDAIGLFGAFRVGSDRVRLGSELQCPGCGRRSIDRWIATAPMMAAIGSRQYEWCVSCGPMNEGPAVGAQLGVVVTDDLDSVEVTVAARVAAGAPYTGNVRLRLRDKGLSRIEPWMGFPVAGDDPITVTWKRAHLARDQHALEVVWVSSEGVWVLVRPISIV